MKEITYIQLIRFCAALSIKELILYIKKVRHLKNRQYLVAKEVLRIRLSQK